MVYIREGAPSHVRSIAADFTNRGIALPTEITEALTHLDTIEAARPEQAGPIDLTNAYLDGATPKQIDTLAVAAATSTIRATAWREARIKQALRTLRLFPAYGDELTHALAELAAPLIANLEHAATIDAELGALVRAGRHDDAAIIGRIDIDAEELQCLYSIRGTVTTGAVWMVDWTDCSQWKDPHKLDTVEYHGTATDRYRAGIRAGAGLWFPTPDEAVAQAEPIAAEIREGNRTAVRTGANYA